MIQKRREAEKVGLIAPGDIGYFDEDEASSTCATVAKDMIISGGVNIYPAEIEAELMKMPGIADCGVFGIPDEEYGEAVCRRGPAVARGSISQKPRCAPSCAATWPAKEGAQAGRLPCGASREDSGQDLQTQAAPEPFWAGLDSAHSRATVPKSRLELRPLPMIVAAYLVAPLVAISGLWLVWQGPWRRPASPGCKVVRAGRCSSSAGRRSA